jgi:hypothetical protein|mmetsp:Transcript_47841/g.63256  ORF Transcript_47841/g.63256 Transcript_47841/m.63256 type:complete len:225 (-) Transcript_47841:565-1239(-)|eukprot:CAMPEP_0185609506 /NCGR_PEP_ID=MMETSP0436-20130131/9789_1 /TAXON_ID=626734 ORGANISM="Favella taraikaensis, Strain Fe Narragansett Bay" /NCGR_SAMPLE_ID=MMETSP0436 /ASSEMBLY_ACC=CAM_ASM_000390 /LENGTH=224 /DNA_ID=CAMNT_0028241929 /DNA_START=269 /DNA_END=943 /DNA_ORIENTATION=-
MVVVDLDHVELLDDAAVQAQLLCLELGEGVLADVDQGQSVKLLLRLSLTLVPLQLVLDGVHVARVLEQRVHGLLAVSDVFNVRLGLSNLLGRGSDGGLSGLELVKGSLEGGKVVNFTLYPVVQVSERVPQVVNGVAQRLDQVTVLHVVDDKFGVVAIRVVAQVVVLIACEGGGRSRIALDQLLLIGEVASDVVFHLLQEGVGLLEEDLEVEELRVKNVLLLLRE